MILRLIIWGIALYILFRLFRYFFPSRKSQHYRFSARKEERAVNDMVQDPQCGVYVSPKEAFSARVGDKVLYFCSQQCLNKYLKKK